LNWRDCTGCPGFAVEFEPGSCVFIVFVVLEPFRILRVFVFYFCNQSPAMQLHVYGIAQTHLIASA